MPPSAGEPAVLLDTVTGPADLRDATRVGAARLAAEIRGRLIDVVCRTGGHLGPNLGVVELTIALHRVFDSPRDAIVWDTGHQSYVHKMLTGRGDDLAGLRQAGGLSGYPSRAESAHDLVENSHASTALSYVDGLAKAFAVRGGADRAVVARRRRRGADRGHVLGGAEQHRRAADRPVVIVLNDNGRSYAPTVGVVGIHLAGLREAAATAGRGRRARRVAVRAAGHGLPRPGRRARRGRRGGHAAQGPRAAPARSSCTA